MTVYLVNKVNIIINILLKIEMNKIKMKNKFLLCKKLKENVIKVHILLKMEW